MNEEDIGEVKIGMKAAVQLYAYRNATVQRPKSLPLSLQPIPTRSVIQSLLDLQNPPENLMAGMTGEMNIITGRHENALLVPTRALAVDQVLAVRNTILEKRTVQVGYRTLEFSEVLERRFRTRSRRGFGPG